MNTNDLVITRAERTDAPEVAKLVQALVSEISDEQEEIATEVAEQVFANSFVCAANAYYIARNGANPVGVISLDSGNAIYAGGSIGTIRELYVVPEFRSQGVGDLLVERAMDHAKEAGWKRVEVTTPEPPNQRTIAFYLGCGFAHTGQKLKRILN